MTPPDDAAASRDPRTPTNSTENLSLLREVHRILTTLPDEAHLIYEAQYGGAAREALENASDIRSLEEVVRRYLHTTSGAEAAYRLAGTRWETGSVDVARTLYDRLLEMPRARQRLGFSLVVRGAVAAWLEGDAPRSIELLKELHIAGDRRITFRGATIPLRMLAADPVAWLTNAVGPGGAKGDSVAEDWRVMGGDSRRTATAEAAAPYLASPGWKVSLSRHSISSAEGDSRLSMAFGDQQRDVLKRLSSSGIPLLPAQRPIIVGDRVITRSFGQVVAFDLVNGRMAWKGADPDSLLAQRLGANAESMPERVLVTAVDQLIQDRSWYDQTFGALAADSERVYAIESIAVDESDGAMNPFANQNAPLREENRLAAYDVRTGKLRWRVGSPANSHGDFAGSSFLGAPLPHEGRIYGLVEFADEIRLVVLDAKTGQLEWSRRVAKLDIAIGTDFFHVRKGLTPSLSGTTLICPTDAGRIVALDIVQRMFLWEYAYRSESSNPGMVPNRMFANPLNGADGLRESLASARWMDCLALVAGSTILITPRAGDSLRAIDLQTGQQIWSMPRGDGLFVGGVSGDVVVVVGRSSVKGVRLSDGKPAWNEVPVALASGRGYIAGQHFHQPLSTGELIEIDVVSGREMSRIKTADGSPLGNLVAARGTVISQLVDTLAVFHDISRLERTIEESLAQNPDDARLLAVRGQLLLHRGKRAEAYEAFHKALTKVPEDEQIRSSLVSGMLELIRLDFSRHRESIPDVEKLLSTDADRFRFHRVVAEGYAAAGDSVGSLTSLLRLAEVDLRPAVYDELGEGGWRARTDVMIAGRTLDLFETASSGERERLESLVNQRWSTLVATRSPDELRRFIALFGASKRSDDARLALARLLGPQGDWLEIELLLADLLARATETKQKRELWPLLYNAVMETGRPRDAWMVLKDLAARFPDVDLPSGQTALREFVDWRLEDPDGEDSPPYNWPSRTPKVRRTPANGPVVNSIGSATLRIPISTNAGHWFRDITLEFDQSNHYLVALTPERHELWRLRLPDMNVVHPSFPLAWATGHLLVIGDGLAMWGIDTVGTTDRPGPRLAWSLSVARQFGGNPIQSIGARVVLPAYGMPFTVFTDKDGKLFQSVQGVSSRYFACRWVDQLIVLDPLTGEERWSRKGIAPGSQLSGDDEWLLCAADNDTPARRFRLCDGKEFPAVTMPASARTVATRNGVVVHVSESSTRGDGKPLPGSKAASPVNLMGTRPVEGTDVWSIEVAAGSTFAPVGGTAVAAIEPKGRWLKVDIVTGEVLGERTLSLPERPDPRFIVLPGLERDLVVVNTQTEINRPNLIQAQLRSTRKREFVDGKLYGIPHSKELPAWEIAATKVELDGMLPVDLPFIHLWRNHRTTVDGPAPNFGTDHLTLVDSRNGSVFFDESDGSESLAIQRYTVDLRNKQITLPLVKSSIVIDFSGRREPAAGPADQKLNGAEGAAPPPKVSKP